MRKNSLREMNIVEKDEAPKGGGKKMRKRRRKKKRSAGSRG